MQEQVYSEEKAVIHNNLAALFYEKDLTSSIGHYQKALGIFNELRNLNNGQYTAQSTNFALAYAL
ncbi:MAG: hypothetical protein U5K51_12965 [Flavobacteriaceae bacterium]|nr:hypothetical protein [Flavobacteriaceae bacterium]